MSQAPAPLQILVVDDSPVARHLLARAIQEDPDLALAGAAANGREALDLLPTAQPDAVVLDLEMPVMDGLTTLRQLRVIHPRLPVVVFSSLTHRGAAATLEAISLGADGFALKPTGPSAASAISSELLPLVKELAGRGRPRPELGPQLRATGTALARPDPNVGVPAHRTPPRVAVPAVLVGVSTGGPRLLTSMLAALPGDLAAPILVVQHMPEMFTSLLANRLDAACALHVVEADPGVRPLPGNVYIAPGGHHLGVRRSSGQVRLQVHDDPPENSCRPAVDVLFREAAAAYGPGLLALVLTGMGQDGTAGARAVRQAGGTVVVEDPSTAVVGSMPASVIAAGLADRILPAEQLSGEIVAAVRRGLR